MCSMNSAPDIQYFPASGIWDKPRGAVRVDIVLHGADGGSLTRAVIADHGHNVIDANGTTQASQRGSILAFSYGADELPDTVKVTVGKGGRPGGRDGYALVITHLEDHDA
jgi:hypothetical protein